MKSCGCCHVFLSAVLLDGGDEGDEEFGGEVFDDTVLDGGVGGDESFAVFGHDEVVADFS